MPSLCPNWASAAMRADWLEPKPPDRIGFCSPDVGEFSPWVGSPGDQGGEPVVSGFHQPGR